MPKKICVVTGSRADYGLLYWVLKELQSDLDLELQLIVTGMHLSPEFGLTYQEIEKDGFAISWKVEMLMSSDSPIGIGKSIGVGVMGFSDALFHLKPDILVLLGDRFEILSAAVAALAARIPMAHIVGGDTTEGAIDEAIRHSLTKMSHLHFVTNEKARIRVIQMGEQPETVFNVGSPGLDYIRRLEFMDRAELEKILQFEFRSKNLLITFHPATLDTQPPEEQFQNLLEALDGLGDQFGYIFTKANADNEGRIINEMIDRFAATHSNARAFTSLGPQIYLSTMAQVDAVVGNSSSGLYEAPSLKKPTVNIGDRQRGRIQASSVISCNPNAADIIKAVRQALVLDCSKTVNPYGDGHSAECIASILKRTVDPLRLLQKKFHDFS